MRRMPSSANARSKASRRITVIAALRSRRAASRLAFSACRLSATRFRPLRRLGCSASLSSCLRIAGTGFSLSFLGPIGVFPRLFGLSYCVAALLSLSFFFERR
jgi:hypothetical protein